MLVVLLLAVFSVSKENLSSQAQPSKLPHISTWKVADLNGVDWTNKTLVAGGKYRISMTITVQVSQPDTTLRLETQLLKSEDRFWSLGNEYGGINTTTWQPGRSHISFIPIEGNADLTLVGEVSKNYTLDILAEGTVLHTERALSLARLSFENTGQLLEDRVVIITDEKLTQFDLLLTRKIESLAGASVDQRFKNIYLGVMEQANATKRVGQVDVAIALLNVLPNPDSFVPEPGIESTFLFIAIGLGILSIVLVLVVIRTRSSAGYIYRQIEEKTRKLDLTLIKLSRIDKAMAGEISQIRAELEKVARKR
ncbi:MAG: hypothetical protein ACE5KG_07305 [Nitrososphaerales archaeon]